MTGIPAMVDHLFRREAGKMVATLVRVLGPRHVDLAEDVVQDALCSALESWKYHGAPENPSAWLFQAARHRAIDLLRRNRTFDRAAQELSRRMQGTPGEGELRDDQLRMMFACAPPSLPPEAQVAVILKYLCGFGVGEIAQAFLTSVAAVEKRLARAKRSLQRGGVPDEIGAKGAAGRLDAVQQALYLLFSEGYHGSHPERSVREELCAEAFRMGALLAEHPATATRATFALLGLMSFHASRLPSRIDDSGSLILLEAQDRSLWSRPLIDQGFLFLSRSCADRELTPYHLEAGIAAQHALARSIEETDWRGIYKLYSLLHDLRPTAIVALNRAIALGRAENAQAGLRELEGIRETGGMKRYPFLEAARGDLEERAGRRPEARAHFQRALALARNDSERRVLQQRLARLA
ncbi:MAG TPA: sigma-70 family RNA polymerase sigma factor [Planctomycetota bacterium]|nr:sigma-70 family RNA polymerase sigma factor [Planctomycetota bacterium]